MNFEGKDVTFILPSQENKILIWDIESDSIEQVIDMPGETDEHFEEEFRVLQSSNLSICQYKQSQLHVVCHPLSSQQTKDSEKKLMGL